MEKGVVLLFFAVIVAAAFSLNAVADGDDYKPYLHKATVPEHPKVKLYGSYETSLFPGAVNNEGAPLNVEEIETDIKLTKDGAIIVYKNLFQEGVGGDYHDTILRSFDRYGNVYKINIHGTIQRSGKLEDIRTYSNNEPANRAYERYLRQSGSDKGTSRGSGSRGRSTCRATGNARCPG